MRQLEADMQGMPKLSSRLFRRVIIMAIFLAVFGLTGFGLKRVVTPAPTCTDGVMNGEEEGIDCGTSACGKYCEPDLEAPKVISTKLIKATEGDYDFIAEINNPHDQFGASEVGYELVLQNAEGDEISKHEGVFYILPKQTKHLILTHLTTDSSVKKIDFNIKSAKWQKIDSLEGMNLIVRNEKFTLGAGSTAEAVIFNDSDFDFEIVDLDVVLYNSQNEIIGVNKSDIRTFVARTERAFVVIWPFKIGGKVARIGVYPSTNLFENSNFIKSYGSTIEKFQQY